DHGPHSPTAALAPDVSGAELRHLLVLSPPPRLRPGGGADPVSPLEPAVGGDDLLRLRQLRVAEGDLRRLDHAAPIPASARTGARTRREGAGCAGDDRARSDVRHLPATQALDRGARPRRWALRALVVRAPVGGDRSRRRDESSLGGRRPLPPRAAHSLRGLPE